MAVKLGDPSQQAANDAIVDLIDGGTTNAAGCLRFYTGAQNADGNVEATGQICEIDFANPAYAATDANGDAALAGGAISGVTSGAGTIQSAAVLDRDRDVLYTLTVTATGGGGDIELTSTTFGSGETINITSLPFSTPQNQS